MIRSRLGWLAILVLGAAVTSNAGPATPSYHAIERAIVQIETEWKSLAADQNPHGPAWLEFFSALRTELRSYTTSKTADERVAALNAVYAKAQALDAASWPLAVVLRDELRHWLQPRVALAWAEYRLVEALPTDNAELKAKWLTFLDQSLRPAVRDVESAGTVAAQLSAVDKLNASVDALAGTSERKAWPNSAALHRAVEDLYRAPNVELSIDSTGISQFIMPQGIVEPGPVFFRNRWSYVTAGPVLGIGFIPTNDGIQVSVRQALTSTTPVLDFQQQIAADSQGQRAAKMYEFSATTRNDAVLTMVALFRVASGLYLAPNYEHGVSAQINSAPQPGGGMQRMIASLIGQNQKKITDKVYEGAISEMRANVIDAARELSGIRTSESAAQLNAQIRPYVIDGQTMGNDKFQLTSMSLQTLGTHAVATGVLSAKDETPRAAFAPQPRQLLSPAAGVTADVHLPTALSNLIAGAYKGDAIRDAQNVMVGPPAAETGKASIQSNVSYADYLKAVQDARAAGAQPQFVRIDKPQRPPVFSADANGNLVVLVSDLKLDVPAPEQAARGGLTGPPALVYRIQSAAAEVNLAVVYEADAAGPRLSAKIVSIDAGPSLQVLAITDDETKAQPLNPIQARVIMTALSGRASGQSIPLPLDSLPLSSFVVNSVSKLDPTGWIRVVLMPSK